MPKISVVMPAYNAEKYIAEAISSILNQTYRDFEFIIINDGSTDETEEIILSFVDERIIYLKNEKNMGIVYSLNRGLDMAQGEYIARMDSDDISLPERFHEQIKFLEKHKNIAALGTALNIFGENIEPSIFKNSSNYKEAKAELFFTPSLAHPTVIIRKSILTQYDLYYEEEYVGMEDFRLWWRISQHSNVKSLDKVLLNYRKHTSQMTANTPPQRIEKVKQFLIERIEIFGIDYSAEEFDALFKYRMGYRDKLTPEDAKNLICLFQKLLKANKKQKHFNNHYFKQVLGLAINRSVSHLDLSESKKFNIHYFAFKKGVISFTLFLKLLLHKLLKR